MRTVRFLYKWYTETRYAHALEGNCLVKQPAKPCIVWVSLNSQQLKYGSHVQLAF